MAEIIQNEGGGKKKGKKRAKKHSSHIDMTPMVDLACLLLTFFMLTTAFAKPKVMEVVFPEKKTDETVKQPEIDKDKVLNIVIDENDQVYWFNGMVDPTKPPMPTINVSDYSKDGIRKVLLKRNEVLFTQIEQFSDSLLDGTLKIPNDSIQREIRKRKRNDKVGPMVMIKAMEGARYANIVDIIDEMSITNIARYAIVDLNPVEKKYLEEFKKSLPQK